jgi:hypothetical protein
VANKSWLTENGVVNGGKKGKCQGIESSANVKEKSQARFCSRFGLAVLEPNRIIYKHTDANCSSFHLRVFLGLSNPQGQRQISTISIPRDNFEERKAKFNLEMSRTSQMQLYKCIHVP